MSESVIFCEGYHDRAFWAGWLLRLGCTDPGEQPGKAHRMPVSDPWGTEVRGGHFAFRAPGGGFLKIVPCHGKPNVRSAARVRLKGRADRKLNRLVISVDSDAPAPVGKQPASALTMQSLETLLREFGEPQITAEGDFAIDGGATLASLVAWQAADDPIPGLPDQQTLERVVCAAIVAAHPLRGPAVGDWLVSRPQAPQAGPKEFG